MSACTEVDSEDSAHRMSIASGTTSADSSDHTQEMNFDDYIEWHEASYQPDSDAARGPVSTCPDHTTDIQDQENRDSEDIDEPGQAHQQKNDLRPADATCVQMDWVRHMRPVRPDRPPDVFSHPKRLVPPNALIPPPMHPARLLRPPSVPTPPSSFPSSTALV